jgi:hypothetical protein
MKKNEQATNENKGMTLVELQEILGNRVRVTLREDMTPEQRQIEHEQSHMIMLLAKQMINNGQLILQTEKLAAQNKNLVSSVAMKLIGE